VTRDYELGFILNPEVNEDETRTILDRVEQIVATHGGQVVKVNQWGRRRLAYPIERHRDGNYIFIDMILTPETVAELERTLKVSEVVLRHMVTKRDPKAVQKEREERAEREARAAAAAAAAASEAEAAAAAATAASAEVVAEAPAETAVAAEANAPAEEVPAETPEATPVGEETPAVSSEEEVADVPPAIEESVES
jgi:small subunit ribosomal protein S6